MVRDVVLEGVAKCLIDRPLCHHQRNGYGVVQGIGSRRDEGMRCGEARQYSILRHPNEDVDVDGCGGAGVRLSLRERSYCEVEQA